MRKFYLRWWWTANHEQDRYQQAIREWVMADHIPANVIFLAELDRLGTAGDQEFRRGRTCARG